MSRPHITRRVSTLAASTALAALLASCAENFTTSPVQVSESLSLANWADTIVLGDQHKLMGRVLDDLQRPMLDRTIQWDARTAAFDLSTVAQNAHASPVRVVAKNTQAVPVRDVARFESASGETTFEATAGDSVTVVATNSGWSDIALHSTTPLTVAGTIKRRVTVAVAGVRVSSTKDTTLTAVGDTMSIHATALGRIPAGVATLQAGESAATAMVRSCEVEGCTYLTPFANQGLYWSRVGTGGAIAIVDQGDALGVTAVQDGTDTLVVAHAICATGARCADTVVVNVVTTPEGPPAPTPGGDVVVFNDVNMWENGTGNSVNNQTFFANLVGFGGDSIRASGRTVLFYTGAGAVCDVDCLAPDGGYVGALVSKLTALEYAIVNDATPGLGSIPTNVKVLFVWNPTVTMPASDVNVLKKFASEGGRVVIVGENGGYMGPAGLAAENQLLADLGAQLTNQGGCDVSEGTPAVVAGSHQLLAGVTGLNMACASSMTPGPNDYVLFRDPGNNNVVGAVVKIDLTPLPDLVY